MFVIDVGLNYDLLLFLMIKKKKTLGIPPSVVKHTVR